MNRGQVLAVDFENRKLLKGTQQKSDTKSNKHYLNKTKICDGAVTVFQTKHSGGIWHMRAYLASEAKYFQKSLRTKDKASAIDKATYEHARLLVLKAEGKAVFSPTVYKAVEMYIKYRYDTDVLMQRITEGRWSTVKTHMNWFKKFLNAEHRLDTITAKALVGYQAFRRDNGAADSTIRNEQAIINHFCAWAKEEGLHNVTKYNFPIISIKGDDKAATRRGTFTDDEYERCYKDLQTYCSKAQLKADFLDKDKAFTRHLFRHWWLIQANTMMRNGELFGLKWKNVETYTATSGERVAQIIVESHTSKVRKSRVFIARRGDLFDRLKAMSTHAKAEDFVFTMHNGAHWHKHNRRALDYQFHNLMKRVGLKEYKQRKIKLYSLRHYGITKRLLNGVTNLTQFALDCGTSVEHITKTYYHSQIEESEKNALMMKVVGVDKN
jgi:integrase